MRPVLTGVVLAASLVSLSALAAAEESRRDRRGDPIAEMLGGSRQPARVADTSKTDKAAKPAPAPPAAAPASPADPREGDPAYEQARKLMRAIDAILQDTARQRADARKLPSKDDFLVTPIWTETKEDRERKIQELLDAALGIVTDLPIVDVQKRIEARRKAIREIDDLIAKLREKRLTAPKDALLPGILTDTVESLDKEIADAEKRIVFNKDEIKKAKGEIQTALTKSGIKMSPEQIDLLLDSVLSGDLVRLVASFNAARLIDQQLAKLVGANSGNLAAARKYFAMHAALFAMLVHGQNQLIAKIDKTYLPRLAAIEKDVQKARAKTKQLLKSKNRPDQQRALEANLRSQDIAQRGAAMYRSYLLQQREQLAKARARAMHDLRIADNTYETVEASFQLRALMRDSDASFEAIQKLEAPIFDQIFENEELRREFENLTRKLGRPTS
ncbi:MAG: hypothetical protein R3D31_16900 [Hyphomicrobiaceae bacterium]